MLFAPKHVFTSTQDASIRRVYETRERGGNKRLARQFGVSTSLISQRAAQLGMMPLLPMNKRRTSADWKPAELNIVKNNLDQSTLAIRAALAKKGYRRDCSAINALIHRKRARHEWPSRADQALDRDCYLVQDLMAGLGMSRDQVQRWVSRGWFPAEKWKGGPGCWVIRRRDVRRALRDHAAHWDHRQADKWFLLDIFYNDCPAKIQRSAGKKDSGISEVRCAG